MQSLYDMSHGPESNIFGAIEAGQNAAFNQRVNQNKLSELARMDQARPLIGRALQGDKNAFADLAGADPASYMDVQKFNLDSDRSRADTQSSQLKAKQAEYERVAGVLRSADTPEKWNRAVGFLEQSGVKIEPHVRDFNNKGFVLAQSESEAAELGLNPIYGMDANGNTVAFQPSKAGGLVQMQVPNGVTLTPGVRTIDTADGTQIRNSRTGQLIDGGDGSFVPKNIINKEVLEAEGENLGKQINAAPNVISTGQETLGLLDSIRSHPGMDLATGATSLFNDIPGTQGFDLKNRVNQVKSGAFLSAIPQLQGMGALSNAEGDTATKAVSRMELATSKAEFLSAVDDYERVVMRGMRKADEILKTRKIPSPNQGGGGNAPQVGLVDEGYRYVGGDPADPANWEPAN